MFSRVKDKPMFSSKIFRFSSYIDVSNGLSILFDVNNFLFR